MPVVIFFRKNWLTAGDSSQDRDADDLGFIYHILEAKDKQLDNELSVVITVTSKPRDLFTGTKIPNVDVPKLVTQSQTDQKSWETLIGFSTVVAIAGVSIFISGGTLSVLLDLIPQLFTGLLVG